MFRRRGWPSPKPFHLFLLFLSTTLVVVFLNWLLTDLPSPQHLRAQAPPKTTKIYDQHGRLLYELLGPDEGIHTPLPLDEIPLYLQQATVATEDASFYSNPGISPKGIVRAAFINLRHGRIVSGGSTISQQLARNFLLSSQERSLARKLREAVLAYRINRVYGKDEILVMYLNQTYYGNLAYGVEAAARTYFGKHAHDLNLAECALLAGLPQAPAHYNPLLDLAAAKERQATVLSLMVKNGYITEAEAALARREELRFASVPVPIAAPHFVMYVRNLLEERYGAELVNRGGLQVTTTLDLSLQRQAQAIARRHLAALKEQETMGGPAHNVGNAALVAIDPASGQILAMLGSADYFEANIDGAVNMAQAPRQPGSAIKPILYAAAFDPQRAEPFTPASVLWDVRTSYVGSEWAPYVPTNYARLYPGPVSLRRALGSSYNNAAIILLEQVGIEEMLELAPLMGITTLDDVGRFGLPLALGSGEVRLLELTAAYAVFANGGLYRPPVAILEVRDGEGRILERASTNPDGLPVLSPQVAYLLTDILADDGARISAFGEGSVLKLSRPAAVKTGTTTYWCDNWTVGYTPDLAVGVWVGNADNRPMKDISGITGAAPIWHDFMEEALKARPVLEFEEPEGIVEVEVCPISGQLPGPHCSHRRLEKFIAGTEPTEVCDLHRAYLIDTATGLLATPDCPRERVEERVYLVLPPEALAWGREQGIPQPPTEYSPCAAEAQEQETGGGHLSSARLLEPAITSPDPNAIFRISRSLPLESQKISIAARPGDRTPNVELSLYLDGALLGRYTAPPYGELWQLAPGEHTVVAIARDAAGNEAQSWPLRFTVEQ